MIFSLYLSFFLFLYLAFFLSCSTAFSHPTLLFNYIHSNDVLNGLTLFLLFIRAVKEPKQQKVKKVSKSLYLDYNSIKRFLKNLNSSVSTQFWNPPQNCVVIYFKIWIWFMISSLMLASLAARRFKLKRSSHLHIGSVHVKKEYFQNGPKTTIFPQY